MLLLMMNASASATAAITIPISMRAYVKCEMGCVVKSSGMAYGPARFRIGMA